ncbi:MAG: recombinase zinc beta ribbon domain-containing protein [Candidatus Aminicenantes bacterium]|nr:MAG: recombinase zinc beta ribbon domain-containing protein [Candidatus Aminicenantes bacterium]
MRRGNISESLCGYCGHSVTAETHKGYVYCRCANSKKCQQGYHREEKLDSMFADTLGKFYLDDTIKEWIIEALNESHNEEERFVKSELAKLQREYARNENRLHQVYRDKLDGLIQEDFFKSIFNKIQQRQQEIRMDLDKLKQKNFNYMKEALLILELLQDVKNQYIRASKEQKSKILKILVSNVELKGVNTSFYWNKPFDILFELGQTDKRGPSRYRT